MDELVFNEEDVILPQEETKVPGRVRSIPRQALASIADIVPGIPIVLDAVQAGVTGISSKGREDKGYGERFLEDLTAGEGYKSGMRGIENINEFFNINNPEGTGENLARLLGGAALPIPGSAITKAPGVIKAASVILPTVKTELPLLSKGNAVRFGVQEGATLGINEGIRALTDTPSNFSDGLPNLIPPALAQQPKGGDPVFNEGEVTFEFDEGEVDVRSPADLDRALNAQGDGDAMLKGIAAIGAVGLTILGIAKYRQAQQAAKQLPTQINPGQGAAKDINPTFTDVGNQIHARLVNQETHIDETLKKANVPDVVRQRISEKTPDDSVGNVEELLKHGEALGLQTNSLRDIYRKFEAMDPADQAILHDGLMARYEDIARTRATVNDFLDKAGPNHPLAPTFRQAFEAEDVDLQRSLLQQHARDVENVRGSADRVKVGLFSKATGDLLDDPAVTQFRSALVARPDLKQMAQDIGKINDDVLNWGIKEKVFDKATTDKWKDRFTDKDFGLLYINGKENLEKPLLHQAFANFLGRNTSKGKEMDSLGAMHAQGLKEGTGIQTPLDPFRATAEYTYHVMDHVVKQRKQWEVLANASGTRFDPVSGLRSTAHGSDWKGPRLVGMYDPDNPAKTNFGIKWNNDDPFIKSTFKTQEAPLPGNDPFNRKDVKWVQRDGKFFGFHSDDAGFMRALDFNQGLSNVVQRAFSQSKKLLSAFTVGKFTPFAPTSFMYNAITSGINAALRQKGAVAGAGEGLSVFGNSFNGAWKYFATKTADDISQVLGNHIDRKIGMARISPQHAQSLNNYLRTKVENSLLRTAQAESGRFSSSIASDDVIAGATNIFEKAIPHISEKWGVNGAVLAWKMWSNFNSAMHEGTAYGMMLREMNRFGPGATGHDIRAMAKNVKDVTGDVRRRGSSEAAEWIQAAVPFSGATIQAWNAFGSAAHKAGLAKTFGTLVSAVGIPAASSLVWNSMLTDEFYEDEQGRIWNHADYYWNGLTTDQRNNNFVMMVPSRPPWNPILIPVPAEISVFKAFVDETMDAVFGLSRVGDAGLTKVNGNHMLAALTRVFDIPVPPPIAAASTAAFGADFRVGPSFEEGDKGFRLFTGVPFATGEKITNNFGRQKYVNSEFDTKTAAILEDIFGAGASMMMAIYESFNSGKEGDTPLSDRFDLAAGTTGQELAKQFRYSSIWTKALHPNPNNSIAEQVYAKKENVMRASKELDAMISKGLVINGVPVAGNTIEGIEDPGYQTLITSAKPIQTMLKPMDDRISKIRREISEMYHASSDPRDGTQFTARSRKDRIDALNLEIQGLKAQQLVILQTAEDDISEFTSQQTGDATYRMNLSNVKPRPNIRD